MSKRGQVTVFVILGIVVLVALGLFLSFRMGLVRTDFGKQASEELVPAQLEPIREHIEGCIEEKGKEVIDIIGRQGGFVDPGFYSMDVDGSKMAYFYYCNDVTDCVNVRPNLKGQIADEIMNYVNTNLNSCFSFDTWRDRGYTLELGNYDVNTLIGDKATTISLRFPIKIGYGGVSADLDEFSKSFEVPLGIYVDSAYDVVEEFMVSGSFNNVPYYLLPRSGERIVVDINSYGDSRNVYVISSRNYDYEFKFAGRGFL